MNVKISLVKYKLFFVAVLIFLFNLISIPIAAEETNFESQTPHSNIEKQDDVITINVKNKIASDLRIAAPNIEVTTNQGIVVLKGSMNTVNEAKAAIEDASSIPGVVDVDTSSIVMSEGTDPTFPDMAISAKIRGNFIRANVLEGKPFLNINAETRDGVVFLTGRVDTMAQARDAVRLAESVANVKRVESRILVNFPY